MKYFPLIWAGLWRKPTRALLTLLAVTAAFTLFGLAIGLNAAYAHLIASAHADRLYVLEAFDLDKELTVAQGDEIARLPGIIQVSRLQAFLGYYRDPKRSIVPLFADHEFRKVQPDLPMTDVQWRQLWATPNGVFISRRIMTQYGLKTGDALPVLTRKPSRRDGSKLWLMQVLGIIDDLPIYRIGLILGNFDYYDHARLLVDQGGVYQYQVLIADPAKADATASAIDALFANSAHPTWTISEKTLTESNTRFQFNVPLITEAVAGAGLFMILFLTGNVLAQSVRERIPEFAVLKTLGYSDDAVTILVFVEAAIPCLLGAGIGFGLAQLISSRLSSFHLPPTIGVALPDLSAQVLAVALAFALGVAFLSTAIPALRLRRLDVATALRR